MNEWIDELSDLTAAAERVVLVTVAGIRGSAPREVGAKMINAVSNSTVPQITIMTGSSYGAGNYAMVGRSYSPRFLFTWPNHKIAVMGGKQLAGVLDIIQRDAAQKKGIEVDEQRLQVAKMMTEKMIEDQSTALYASARLWDDGIIDPRDTRTVPTLPPRFSTSSASGWRRCRSTARRSSRAPNVSLTPSSMR